MDVDSSSKFIGSLTKFLQSLCNGYVEFQRGVELVGHIYLSIDTGEKVDYILHEKVSKNDENSVTFVSNSFHARPLDKDKDKEKTSSNKDVPTSKTGASARGSKDTSSDEDDDVMIVDKSKGVLGSTNSGTILPRGVKRVASPSSDQRPVQRTRSSTGPSSARQGSGSNPVTSPPRTLVNRQQAGGPSATVTSQDSQQENLNMGDLKLEQITRDELLSLASQVGEGGSGPPPASSVPRSQSQRTGAAAANSSGDRPVWIKQEAADDNGAGDSDAGWSCARDDSNSNSGSNLYPVMLHQNPAAYSNPVFPGFSGPNTSGSPSAVNPYTNPMPGSSQDISGLDPSGKNMRRGARFLHLKKEDKSSDDVSLKQGKGSFFFTHCTDVVDKSGIKMKTSQPGSLPENKSQPEIDRDCNRSKSEQLWECDPELICKPEKLQQGAFGTQRKKKSAQIKTTPKDGQVHLRCELCFFFTKHRKSMWRHVKSVHENRVYVCEHCGKQFKQPESLKHHMHTVHC